MLHGSNIFHFTTVIHFLLKQLLNFVLNWMAPKAKIQKTAEEGNPSTISLVLDHMPLVESPFKINDCECEFNFYELHSWLKLKYANTEYPIHF